MTQFGKKKWKWVGKKIVSTGNCQSCGTNNCLFFCFVWTVSQFINKCWLDGKRNTKKKSTIVRKKTHKENIKQIKEYK